MSPARNTTVVSIPASGHQRRVRPRDDHGPLLGLREHPGQVEHVLGFETEVELLDDLLREQLDQRGGIRERRDGDAADEVRSEPGEGADVSAHQRRDLGPLNLDHDRFAGDELSPVDLGDRRRRDGFPVETGEDLLERATEVRLDDGPDRRERLGRDLVAELLELRHQLVGEQALERRDDLTELDVRGAEPLERLPQPA